MCYRMVTAIHYKILNMLYITDYFNHVCCVIDDVLCIIIMRISLNYQDNGAH